MGLFKWFFKRMTGIELVDPDPNYVPEPNDAEQFLDSSSNWPKKVEGEINLIDSTGDDVYCFHWAIGTLEMSGFKDSILIEFKDEILISSGLCDLEEFPSNICVLVNPAINEYYQVVSVEKT